MAKTPITIAFVVAMLEEFSALNFAFKNVVPIKNTQHNFIIYKVEYNNINLVAIISGIGKTLSATATTYLINTYNPNYIINVGSSGGINKAKLGDIVISNTTGFFDVDVTAFGYKYGQIPSEPHLFVSSNNFINSTNLINNYINNKNIVTGTIATGDSFINSNEKINNINNIYLNLICIEMEAASIALTCKQFNKDVLFIKKISDTANNSASNDFSNNINSMEKGLSHLLQDILNNFNNFK